MMFFLILHIVDQVLHIERIDRKTGIADLPFEAATTGILSSDCLCRLLLHLVNHRIDRHIGAYATYYMDVIFDPTTLRKLYVPAQVLALAHRPGP